MKRDAETVIAVQIDLDTTGFSYKKWGGTHRCKAGDWLVNNNGDTYTVDGDSFSRTYRATGPGTYVKVAPVWAEIASAPGRVRTKEGTTHYEIGDYLVYNGPEDEDTYAVSKDVFERMYQRTS
jgi:hypothetical protein